MTPLDTLETITAVTFTSTSGTAPRDPRDQQTCSRVYVGPSSGTNQIFATTAYSWPDRVRVERSAFYSKLPELGAYKGMFVAFSMGKLVGSGPSRPELARKLFDSTPNQPFYIGYVGREPEVIQAVPALIRR